MNQNPRVSFRDSETSFMIDQPSQARQTGAQMVQGKPILKKQAPSLPVGDTLDWCKNGYIGCFCLNDHAQYDTCKGPMSRPPPY